MKMIFIIMILSVLSACSYFVSKEELARQIQAQMQSEFNSNLDYQHYHLTVEKVRILERQGLGFKAVSQLRYQEREFPIEVEILHTDGGYAWHIDKEDFAFIDEIEIEKYQAQLDLELKQLAQAIEHDDLTSPVTFNLTAQSATAYQPLQSEKVTPTITADNRPIPVGNITAYTH